MKAVLLLVAFGVASRQASESIDLVARHAQGDVFEEKESFWSSSSNAALDAEDAKPSFAWDSIAWDRSRVGAGERDGGHVSASTSTILDDVLAVKDGKRVKVKRTFVASSSTLVETTGGESMSHAKVAAFEGQTVVLVAEEDGVRIVGELDGEEELDESDLGLASRWEQLLPAAPVAIGQTWSLSEGASKRLLKGMNVAKATAWCTLESVEPGAAGKAARIKLEIRATAARESAATTEIDASGAVLWSLEAGHLVELALSGKIHVTGPDLDETSTFGVSHETRKLE